MLTEIFLSFVVTSGVGAVLVICRLLYKSKCKNFELCCLKVERDAVQENHADLIVDMARRMSNTSTSSTNSINDKVPVSDQILRYENIYYNPLPKNAKKPTQSIIVPDISLSNLESGEVLSNVSVT